MRSGKARNTGLQSYIAKNTHHNELVVALRQSHEMLALRGSREPREVLTIRRQGIVRVAVDVNLEPKAARSMNCFAGRAFQRFFAETDTLTSKCLRSSGKGLWPPSFDRIFAIFRSFVKLSKKNVECGCCRGRF